MSDPNSLEAIAARADQEDPIVMYLIIKESLGMSIGKSCAQAAHASQMLQIKYQKLKDEQLIESDPISRQHFEIYQKWIESDYRKVVLKADDNEFDKIKNNFVNHVIIKDAGLTEIAPGETCIGLWPQYRSDTPKIIKRLQVLK